MSITTVVVPVTGAIGSINVRVEAAKLDADDDGLIAQPILDELSVVVAFTVTTLLTAIEVPELSDGDLSGDEVTGRNPADIAIIRLRAEQIGRAPFGDELPSIPW